MQVNVVQSHGMLLPLRTKSPIVYGKMQRRDLLKIHKSTSDSEKTSTSESGDSKRSEESKFERYKSVDTPERYTRTSGHRAMHQSGWSFSGWKKCFQAKKL